MKLAFKGFDQISDLEYKTSEFVCAGGGKGTDRCTNECKVTQVVTSDGRTIYVGDVCERYSGVTKIANTNLPDLFGERARLLERYADETRDDGRVRIGVPRTGYFYELFPFLATFLKELDMRLVPSRKTDKGIIESGLRVASAGFCFPYQVAFGHFADLEGRVDYVLAMDVIETFRTQYASREGIRETDWDRSFACPYLQNFGAVVAKVLSDDVRVVNPHLFLRGRVSDSERELFNAFRGAGLAVGGFGGVLNLFSRVFGGDKKTKKSDIRRAFGLAKNVYFDFKRELRKKGESAIRWAREEGVTSLVVVGRPYTSFDEAVNLNLASKISGLGCLPIPQDFLPLPREDLSKRWGNEFAAQGQSILGSASVIRDLGLEAVFLDYFGCGPDSFIHGFFKHELGKPHLVLQIDEHTADAGLITRLEAFVDSVHAKKKKNERK